MSAYVASDQCINRILASKCASEPLCRVEDRQDFGQRMRAMNVEAVNARYGETADRLLPNEAYQYKGVLLSTTAQALKSLGCFLYQCSEGNVPELSLFKELDKYRDALAYHIATSTPEYEAAEWG